jgi:multiple antibiotic resistance protein
VFNHDLFVSAFIALFALLNPFYTVPVFLSLTGDHSHGGRRRTAVIAAVTVLLALLVAALVGDQVLDLFGIHVAALQIAGGLIVLSLAFGILKGEPDEERDTKEALEERARASADEKSIAVYPLAIPLLAGPAVFVTTVVFSSRVDLIGDMMGLATAIVAISFVTWLAMALATPMARLLNKTAINIGTRILGILLAAIAVEMIIAGIDDHYPYLTQGG